MKCIKTILLLLILNITVFCQSLKITSAPELFAPGIVSIENSEVKITFSKDGRIALWGAINRKNGVGGLDIWKAVKSEKGWSEPEPVSFNTKDNDFDPCFSADGKILYFFSNKPGGEGGDDIYFVKYDSVNRSFGEPVNMGKEINTKGDEWGPTESTDGKKFMFCTDGLGGKGKHDIFICEKAKGDWGKPKAVSEINSPEDDFDPVFLSDCKTIIFSQKLNEDEVYLYVSYLTEAGYSKPERLKDNINISGTWNFGSSLDSADHSYFYYSTHREDNTKGKLDIYKVKYTLTDK